MSIFSGIGPSVSSLSGDLADLVKGVSPYLHEGETSSIATPLGYSNLLNLVSSSKNLKEGVENFQTALKTDDVGGRTIAGFNLTKGIASGAKTVVDLTSKTLSLLESGSSEIGGNISTILERSSSSLSAIKDLCSTVSYSSSVKNSIEKISQDENKTLIGTEASKSFTQATKSIVSASTTAVSFSEDLSTGSLASFCETLGKVAAALGIIDKVFSVTVNLMKLEEIRRVRVRVKNERSGAIAHFYKAHQGEFERVAPKSYKKLTEGKLITPSFIEEVIAELEGMEKKLFISSVISLISIISAILALVYLEGPLAAVAAIGSLLVTAGDVGMDISGLLKKLEGYTQLSNADLVINLITIVVAIGVTISSMVVAETVLLASFAAFGGVLMLAAPIGTLIYLKMKEQRETEESGTVDQWTSLVTAPLSSIRKKVESGVQRAQIYCLN